MLQIHGAPLGTCSSTSTGTRQNTISANNTPSSYLGLCVTSPWEVVRDPELVGEICSGAYAPPSMIKTTVQLTTSTLTITTEGTQDPRHPAHAQIRRLRDQGISIREIARLLNVEEVLGPCGGKWHGTSVQRVLRATPRRR